MNENIYIQLEDRLRTLELTKSKKEIPWELITKPTLLNKPVDKTPLKFSLIGLLGGFAIGIILCLKKETKSGIIFELEDLINLSGTEFLEIININEIDTSEDKISCLREYIYLESNQKINFINLGNIEENKIQVIKDSLSRKQKNINNIEIINSIVDINPEDNNAKNFLLLEFGSITSAAINNFKKYEKLLKINLSGTIILGK